MRQEVVRFKTRIRRDLFLLGKESRVTKALLVLMSSLNPTTEGDLVFLSRLLLLMSGPVVRSSG